MGRPLMMDDRCEFEWHDGVMKTGVVARIAEVGKGKPIVMIRADDGRNYAVFLDRVHRSLD